MHGSNHAIASFCGGHRGLLLQPATAVIWRGDLFCVGYFINQIELAIVSQNNNLSILNLF